MKLGVGLGGGLWDRGPPVTLLTVRTRLCSRLYSLRVLHRVPGSPSTPVRSGTPPEGDQGPHGDVYRGLRRRDGSLEEGRGVGVPVPTPDE